MAKRGPKPKPKKPPIQHVGLISFEQGEALQAELGFVGRMADKDVSRIYHYTNPRDAWWGIRMYYHRAVYVRLLQDFSNIKDFLKIVDMCICCNARFVCYNGRRVLLDTKYPEHRDLLGEIFAMFHVEHGRKKFTKEFADQVLAMRIKGQTYKKIRELTGVNFGLAWRAHRASIIRHYFGLDDRLARRKAIEDVNKLSGKHTTGPYPSKHPARAAGTYQICRLDQNRTAQ